MPFSLLRTLDDRGAAVTYRDPMYHGSELNRAEQDKINRRIGSKGAQWLIGAAIVTGIAMQIPTLRGLTLTSLATGLVGIAAFTAIAMLFVVPVARRILWIRQWKPRYKQLRRCPACQYSLAALDPEDDGCTRCPECAAAWRLEKL